MTHTHLNPLAPILEERTTRATDVTGEKRVARPAHSTPAQEALALGRSWASADTAYLTVWTSYGQPDGCTVHLRWADGAAIDSFEDTEAEARESLRRYGFAA